MSTPWLIVSVVLGVLLVAGIILWFTPWWQVRWYGARIGQIVKKHDLQKKAEALQKVPDPTKAKKPLTELAKAYDAMVADLEKIKRVPEKAREIHTETLEINRKAAELYRIVASGSFRQREVQRRQQELQKRERVLQQKLEALYGKKAKKGKQEQAEAAVAQEIQAPAPQNPALHPAHARRRSKKRARR